MFIRETLCIAASKRSMSKRQLYINSQTLERNVFRLNVISNSHYTVYRYVCVYWLRKRHTKYKNFFFVYPSMIVRCFSPTQKHTYVCIHFQLCTLHASTLSLSRTRSLLSMLLTLSAHSVYYLLSLTLTVQRRCAANNVCAGACCSF